MENSSHTQIPEAPYGSTGRLARRLVGRFVRPYTRYLVMALIMMAIAAACTASLAKLMEPVLDDIFVNKDYSKLRLITILIFVVFLVKGISTYGQAVLLDFVGQRVIADLQKKMFCHLIGVELAYFSTQSTGTLISRFTNDVNLLKSSVSTVLTGLGKDVLTLIFLVAVMFHQDWMLGIMAFFVFPIAILPIVKIGKKMRKYSTNTQEYVGALTTHLDQTFQDMRTIKAYRLEGMKSDFAVKLIEKVFGLTYKATRVRLASRPIMETLGGLAIVIVIGYGGMQVIDGTRSTGSFFSFITALLLAYEPMKRLANLNANLQEGLAAAQRVFAVLDHHPQISSKPGAPDLTVTKGNIQFKDIQFSYVKERAVNGVSLEVPAGQTVAVVGPSGSGKTTLMNLIPRFYDVDDGALLIDGQDVRDVKLASLRANIALVSQEVGLFDVSVRQNIAFGKPEASQKEIEDAAKAAAAHEFIMQLPNGYETVAGENGMNLSGGQRQRIAIARAFLKDAPILLFDEATSALDTASEQAVKQAMAELSKGRTTVMIAHRLSTIMQADLICVIVDGRVVEKGTHAELVKHDGVYANLYHMQFKDEAA